MVTRRGKLQLEFSFKTTSRAPVFPVFPCNYLSDWEWKIKSGIEKALLAARSTALQHFIQASRLNVDFSRCFSKRLRLALVQQLMLNESSFLQGSTLICNQMHVIIDGAAPYHVVLVPKSVPGSRWMDGM